MVGRALAAALLALVGASCTDPGIVGTRSAQLGDGQVGEGCDPSCGAGTLCHPELAQCVECVQASDCAGDAGTVVCDPSSHMCMPCVDDDPDEPFDQDDDCDLDERDGSIDD